jgi:hypothetical protein
MDFAGFDGEIDAFENIPAAGGGDTGVEVLNLKQGHFVPFFRSSDWSFRRRTRWDRDR